MTTKVDLHISKFFGEIIAKIEKMFTNNDHEYMALTG